MKKALTLCLALVFIFVMAAFPASAATKDLYVKDGGAGDGSQASPFGTLEDAYAAAAALTDDVVIHLDGVTTAETGHFTAPAHTNAITLTGTLKDAHTADWFFISGGPLTLKNLTIEAGAKSVFFLAGVNPFTVDEGVVTTKACIYAVGSVSKDITAGDVNITVKSGATLNFAEGSYLSIAGDLLSPGGGKQAEITGAYGQLVVEEGAQAVFNSGSTLYAWGFATGDGTIECMDGVTVYESFQIEDFAGGSISLEIAASVVIKISVVAILGWIIPDPFAIPPIRQT